MDRVKQFLKYILLVIVCYVITGVLIFIGFNVNYSKISLKGSAPDQITINKAEATKSDGRVYGHIKNSEENNVNGKFIKISAYDASDELLTTEYLKIYDVKNNESKLFKARFIADKISSYSISIVDQEGI